MIGVSNHLLNAVRDTLLAEQGKEMMPVKGMDNHYCSLVEVRGMAGYQLLFPLKVEQQQVYLYLKIN